MSRYLMIDFGSTFTKLTAVDTLVGDVIATSSSFTTVDVDISIGYHNALGELYKKLGGIVKFDQIIACSSAAGGLKMAAIGLVEELTVEAAKRVCLGAGAKVDLVLSHHITNRDIDKIMESNIDIILLAGGTNGGNEECVLYNATMLGIRGVTCPIVYAGNNDCKTRIISIFEKYNLNGYVVDNIMPTINVLNIKEAREKIRELFLENIIDAKGIKKIEAEIDKVILPTPVAVLKASELLAKGYKTEEGLGDLVIVDIGGATTDFYSICSSAAKRSDVILKGLEEPFAKRTVEGDLGMRYSAIGVTKSLSKEEIILINEQEGIDLEKEAEYRYTHVDAIFNDEREEYVERVIGGICVDKAICRHVGKMEEVVTPMGRLYNQIGKDLSQVKYAIGTGGVLVKSKNPIDILKKVQPNYKSSLELRPRSPKYVIDKDYILAAMGLFSQKEPLLALKIMKKHLNLEKGI